MIEKIEVSESAPGVAKPGPAGALDREVKYLVKHANIILGADDAVGAARALSRVVDHAATALTKLNLDDSVSSIAVALAKAAKDIGRAK